MGAIGRAPPTQPDGPKPGLLGPWQVRLSRLWAAGCTNGRALLLEIQRHGYQGSRAHLERLLARWRAANKSRPVVPLKVMADFSELLDPATGHLISPITAAALCMKPRSLLTERQAEKIEALKKASADFTSVRRLAMSFRGLLRSGDTNKLTAWIHQARQCGIYAMQRFARTLQQDLDAVRNAMTEHWSNGQTEGQINRLKTLKRAMYGRAGVELIRARMLPLRPTAH